jgi:hypothetical protein
MADRYQIDFVLSHIETINHPVIPDAQSAPVGSRHAVVLKSRQPQPHIINLPLNKRLDIRWKLEEVSVEFA